MKKLAKLKPKVCLDIGCGFQKQPGFIGLDKRRVDGVDIVHDIEKFPWPIRSGSIHLAAMTHVVEHVKPWLQIDLLNECWRILEDGGILMIKAPYGGSQRFFQDPTHCSPWVEETPMYFCAGALLYQVYKPLPWKLEQMAWDRKYDIELALKKLPKSYRDIDIPPAGKEIGSWRPEGINKKAKVEEVDPPSKLKSKQKKSVWEGERR
jgi:hypothetical protein